MKRGPVKGLLMLGDQRLYQVCSEITPAEMVMVDEWKRILASIMAEIRERYNFGRAIAAPQAGIMKRLIYFDTGDPFAMINPVIAWKSDEMIELWDDCMSLPNLLVKVERHRHITVRYHDEKMQPHEVDYSDDASELFQHEFDHLNGILCTMRALNNRSFRWREPDISR